MDLTGIIDEAEFFPIGTLSESLKDTVNDIISKWDEKHGEEANPAVRFSKFGVNYLDSLRQYRNIDEFDEKKAVYSQMHHDLVVSLGYEFKPTYEFSAFEERTVIPLLGRAVNELGQDTVWLIQTPLEKKIDESSDPLSSYFSEQQFTDEYLQQAEINQPIEKILSEGIFELNNSPKYLLIFGISQVVLVHKQKWTSRSVIRIDLQEIFTRNDKDTFNYASCLISREALVRSQGERIADILEEEAQRTANAVTVSLKKTVRKAIEILGQEILQVTDGKIPYGPEKGKQIAAKSLSVECLRYMYRLLFLLYVEANDRLKILDKRNPVYNSGYSIELLRKLESHRLRTQSEREGTFIWSTLQKTLQYFFEGEKLILSIPPTKVYLLDPKSTPILSSISIRNEAIQKIIRLLSLRVNGNNTVRISYAKLGIGQLGAVYETLISFTGRIAEEDLIQIIPQKLNSISSLMNKNAESVYEFENTTENFVDSNTKMELHSTGRNDPLDELAPSYFVPKSRFAEFSPESVVFRNNELFVYPKGQFMYRLAGRDQEMHASYYTPEPLAKLLVKHALKERCRNLMADEILELKILEPAMGSAAFLVETTNQLADLYLERKQQEINQTIKQENISLEKQRVRALISDRNCFGVDLSEIAVELGSISLWLNSLHGSRFSPWFGDQLFSGNSLLGARRATYAPNLLNQSKTSQLWLNQNPSEIGWRNQLPNGHIWQWLLPAKDMVAFENDNSIKDFASDAQVAIKCWKKSGFFSKFEDYEIKLLQKLSVVAEKMYNQVATELGKLRQQTNDEIEIWPNKVYSGNKDLEYYGKRRLNSIFTGSDNAQNTLPYKRLKSAMDAWCALWFWPLDKIHLLPSRDQFLQGMGLILEGGFNVDGSIARTSVDDHLSKQLNFEKDKATTTSPTISQNTDGHFGEMFQETNVEALVQSFDWLRVAMEVAKKEKFVHFELYFADILKERGGFDLIVGNPPWLPPTWNAGLVLSDFDPKYSKVSAKDAKIILSNSSLFENVKSELLSNYVSIRGLSNVASTSIMNPFIRDGQNNLYRCFIDLSFRLSAPSTICALIHQDGHLSDKSAGKFRTHWYRRIVKHFHFYNTLKNKNFSEVHAATEFSVNIYRGDEREVEFDNICHALLASQIEECYNHDGSGIVPEIKDVHGNWDIRGHKKRIVKIKLDELKLINSIYSQSNQETLETIFVQPMNSNYLEILKNGMNKEKLGQNEDLYQVYSLWNSTGAQKANIITKRNEIVSSNKHVILSGGMIFVGNPYYKATQSNYKNITDFDNLNLSGLPFDFIPRTIYSPSEPIENFENQLQKIENNSTFSHVNNYRIAIRVRSKGQIEERSFVSALIPKGITHTNTILSVSFREELQLLRVAASWVSLPYDFLIKNLRKTNIHPKDIKSLPLINPGPIALHHILRLSCLTSAYSKLWMQNFSNLQNENWSLNDSRLVNKKLTNELSYDYAFRTDFERRMALVELDVLIAQELDYSLDQLIYVYNSFYPIMKQYEEKTWFDQNGNIVWTTSAGLKEMGYLDENKQTLSEVNWQKLLREKPSKLCCTAIDDTLPGGPREVKRHFEGPFDQCDRVEDYKRAWAHFERLKSEGST